MLRSGGLRGSQVTIAYNGRTQIVALEHEWTMGERRQRPWFRCPDCNRRCRLLHEKDGAGFVCRLCSGYDYSCRHRSRALPALKRVRRVKPGLPHRALARERIIAEVEIARLLRATVSDLERRAKARQAMTDPTSDDGRDDFILQERLGGRSARSISKELRCTVGEVDASLDRTLPKIDNDARRRYVALDMNRLDRLLETFYKRAIENADAQAGLLVVKILERRASLLGLDSPQKLDIVQVQPQEAPQGHDRIFEIDHAD